MPSRNRKVRKHLDFLWDNLVKDGAIIVRKDGGVDDNVLDEYNILWVSQFDFENLGSENLIDPMPLDELQKYPVDTSSCCTASESTSRKSVVKGAGVRLTVQSRLKTEDCVQKWAMGSRPNAYDMLEVRDLERLEQPHPFFLNGRAGWHELLLPEARFSNSQKRATKASQFLSASEGAARFRIRAGPDHQT